MPTWEQLVLSCIFVFLITVGVMGYLSKPLSVCVGSKKRLLRPL